MAIAEKDCMFHLHRLLEAAPAYNVACESSCEIRLARTFYCRSEKLQIDTYISEWQRTPNSGGAASKNTVLAQPELVSACAF